MTTLQRFLPLHLLLLFLGCAGTRTFDVAQPVHIVFQPSHQTDTGRDFNEAEVCNSIVEAAMAASKGVTKLSKVWSYNIDTVHHSRFGSNTVIDHTSALDSSGRMSGYAYEITIANTLGADVFVAVHNNGATRRHACWGFIHEGDVYEAQNRILAAALVEEICRVTDLENRGVHGDSSPNRNNYRCANTGKLSFYSLDENVNKIKYRVLLEIGDNQASRAFLEDPAKQRILGEAIQRTLERIFAGSN